MAARVYFKPNGCIVTMPFERLGETGKGTWGLVEDGGWIARPDAAALELLYFSEAEYRHAMRRLPSEEIGRAVELRRKVFWKNLHARHVGFVQEAMWRCIDRTDDDERGLRLRRQLLNLHAKLVDVDRVGGSVEEQMENLYDTDSEIIDDLGCPSLRKAYPVDPDGKERAFRTRFLEQMIHLRWRREMRAEDRTLMDIYRGYAVRPITSFLTGTIKIGGQPATRWHDAVLMGLTDRDVEDMPTYSKQLVFARATEILNVEELTPAQFDVEVNDRLAALDLYPYFMAVRICAASTREALRLKTKAHKEFHELLAKQVEDELRGLALFRKPPVAKPTVDELVAELAAMIDLLVGLLLHHHGLSWVMATKTLGRDVHKLLEEDGR